MKNRFLILCIVLLSMSALAAYPVGDLNRNFIVDLDDLVLFAQKWMQTPDCFNTPGCADLEGNDDVNLEDFALLVQNWQLHAPIPLVINELMASNDATLEDPDEPGEYPDWIEIYNHGNETIRLSGMFLQDDNNLWQIPAGISVQSGQYVLFWADDDDEQSDYHTTLKLDKAADEVTLLSYDGQTIVDSISFFDQTTDISYGRYPDAAGDWYTMDAPTPTVGNNVGQAGEVYFSRLSGTFTSNFSLTLSTLSSTAEIRYTTDGSIPTQSSNFYSGPITIDNAQARQIRARSYESGLAPGPVMSHYYTPLASDVQNFSSNLPIVILDSFDTNIDNNGSQGCWNFNHDDYPYPYQPVASVFIDVDDDTGIASTTDIPDFAGRAGSRIRGESSRCWPKRQYSLELWDENNTDKRASLLGMPAESDWVLQAPYGDKTLMRNVLAFKWANDIEDEYAAPGTKFVEVFYNQNGGNCSYVDYRGVYVLTEKIKVSDDRVDIAKLDPTDTASPDITGGYILRIDKDNGQETFPTSTMVGSPQYFDPDEFALTFDQKQYIQSFFDQFETDLNDAEFNDPNAGYAQYIDIESFIEYDVVAEIFKNSDGLKLSTYFYKERNGKLNFGPHWDYNFSAGNTKDVYPQLGYSWWYPSTFRKTTTSEGWFNQTMPVYAWHSQMMYDIDYQLKTADKWFEHREDKLSDAQITADIDNFYNLLDPDGAADTDSTPADRNFAKWNILNNWEMCNYYYGNNPQIEYYDYPTSGETPIPIPSGEREQQNLPHTFYMEKEWLKNWFNGEGTPTSPEWYKDEYTDRIGKLDAFWTSDRNIDAPPTLKINGISMNTGGTITAGATLTMTGPAGTIYYTTDGTDPRQWTYWDNGEPDPGVDPFTRTLVAESASKAVLIPSGPVSDNWKGGAAFDDSSWNDYTFVSGRNGGVGYAGSGDWYEQYISYDVDSFMHGAGLNNACYIRTPFTVNSADFPYIDTMELRVRFDDAFIAYINGTEVARSSLAPSTPEWNSAATSYTDPESDALIEFDITGYISELNSGSGNILAIHGLNSGNTSSDFLISFELEASSAGVPGSGGGELIEGGSVSASAIAYSGGITLNDSTRIKARVKNGSDWTALNEAYFSDDRVAGSVRITEVMYHPVDPNDEFIEFRNIGPATINLAHCRLTKGVDFTFPSVTLAPNAYTIAVRDIAEFNARYPGYSGTIAGEYTNDKLDNGGENIRLRDAADNIIQEFEYEDNWFPITDGKGFSLNMIDPNSADPNDWSKRLNWQASNVFDGTPGQDHVPNTIANDAIVINEILTHSDLADGDWVELHNTTGAPISVDNWYLSDDKDNLKKYIIPVATPDIPAGGYVVFTAAAHFGSSFGLSEHGEDVFLTSGDGTDIAGGYSVSESFGSAKKEVTFGRHTKGVPTYNTDFIEMSSPTQGYDNSNAIPYPYVPDVVITEIMYNPQNIQDQLGEYIELHNRGVGTAYLYDLANTDNTWKFTKGIDFTFPTGTSIGAGQKILISRTHPDIFKAANGDPGVMVYGPFEIDTELENDGEKIELSMPTEPDPGTGFISYIRVEQVNYSDGIHPLSNDPWPTDADGRGDSLHRTTLSGYANDVANWQAATPTPGS
jgi:hypothetical protein